MRDKERAGLLELNGVVYIAFSSHCDYRPYTGWVMGYDASTLAQTSVIDVTPKEIDAVLPLGEWANPAYFNNTVYYGPVGRSLQAFPIVNARLATTPSSQTANLFGYPGTFPAVSANGTSNGIVWAVENNPINRSSARGVHPGDNPAALHAYDATNLAKELYNSGQTRGRDQFGLGNRFIVPVIVNGKVFVGTRNGVAEFGLLQ